MLNQSNDTDPAALVAAFKALAHPSRLAILELLMEGTHCNCELSERLGLAPNLLSYHLRLLEKGGLVDGVRDAQDARWIYYSIRQSTLLRLRELLHTQLDPARIRPRQPDCGPQHCVCK